mmetsp:Transcript_11513/g.19474  ORF Transcript_11513/g.19474 Transcript_11513/m.19474 type:complete len:143 (-) Transcript_11513:88-516(-)
MVKHSEVKPVASNPNQMELDQASLQQQKQILGYPTQQELGLINRQQEEDLADSDDDLFSTGLKPGDLVDFQCMGNWYHAKIVANLDLMVKVQVLNINTKVGYWLEIESDRLAHYKSKVGSEREVLHKFLQELQGYILRPQQY